MEIAAITGTAIPFEEVKKSRARSSVQFLGYEKTFVLRQH